jgi:hypothetical protein
LKKSSSVAIKELGFAIIRIYAELEERPPKGDRMKLS